MQAFDEVHRAIHYPQDRRFRVWINPWFVFVFAVVAFAPVAVAWGQYLIFGLPAESFLRPINLANPPVPHGFPAWLRLTHFANFFFLLLLVRSGLSILIGGRSRLSMDCGRRWRATNEGPNSSAVAARWVSLAVWDLQ